MIGTLVNAVAVLLGGSAGLLARRRLPKQLERCVLRSVGLFTLALGGAMAVRLHSPVAVVLGLVLGGVLGTALRLTERLEGLGELLKRRFGVRGKVAEGLVSSFVTFCVGPMTVIGSIQDGLGDPSILLAKSVMDGFVAVAYAAAMGVGVLFSVIPLLAYQGSLAALAQLVKPILEEHLLADLTATGGVLLLGLGLELLKVKKTRIGDLLPSLLVSPILSAALSYVGFS